MVVQIKFLLLPQLNKQERGNTNRTHPLFRPRGSALQLGSAPSLHEQSLFLNIAGSKIKGPEPSSGRAARREGRGPPSRTA